MTSFDNFTMLKYSYWVQFVLCALHDGLVDHGSRDRDRVHRPQVEPVERVGKPDSQSFQGSKLTSDTSQKAGTVDG